MQFQHKAVYRMHGINKLLSGPVVLAAEKRDDFSFEATLTENVEEAISIIEWGVAVRSEFAENLFIRKETVRLEDAVAARREQMRAARSQRPVDPCVVFDCSRIVDPVEFKARKDFPDFSVSLNDVDAGTLKAEFALAMESTLIACLLKLPASVDHRAEEIGAISYLREADKPIFLMKLEAGAARVSTSSSIAPEAMQNVEPLSKAIRKSRKVMRATQLLLKSQDSRTEKLEGFIAAWTALEMFSNTAFSSTYSQQWIGLLKSSAPNPALKVIDRLTEVMSDKYRLGDKFAIMASILDSSAGDADIAKFDGALKMRNALLHGEDVDVKDLPIEDAQNLLLKYLRLHLDPNDTMNTEQS